MSEFSEDPRNSRMWTTRMYLDCIEVPNPQQTGNYLKKQSRNPNECSLTTKLMKSHQRIVDHGIS